MLTRAVYFYTRLCPPAIRLDRSRYKQLISICCSIAYRNAAGPNATGFWLTVECVR